MVALVTQNFRIHNAKQFREMFDETELFGGTTTTDAQNLLNTQLYLFIVNQMHGLVHLVIVIFRILQLRQIHLQIQLQILRIRIGKI